MTEGHVGVGAHGTTDSQLSRFDDRDAATAAAPEGERDGRSGVVSPGRRSAAVGEASVRRFETVTNGGV